MSSPAPGPVPPTRRRSLAGPVVLIVMGVVFLMGTMGVLHWHMLGRLFAHYWPLLIILWGIVKLIEHQQAKREGTRASGIGVGGVFLLCCLIVAGLIATQATRVNWTGLRSEEHTSELQSRVDLVCRLLLEKKKSRVVKKMTRLQCDN